MAATLPGGALGGTSGGTRSKWQERAKAPLAARAYLRLGIWQWALRESLDEPTIGTVGGASSVAVCPSDVAVCLRMLVACAAVWSKALCERGRSCIKVQVRVRVRVRVRV